MSATKCNSNLMIVCDDEAAMRKALTIVSMFGLSATDNTTPFLRMGGRQIAVLETDQEIDMNLLVSDMRKICGRAALHQADVLTLNLCAR